MCNGPVKDTVGTVRAGEGVAPDRGTKVSPVVNAWFVQVADAVPEPEPYD